MIKALDQALWAVADDLQTKYKDEDAAQLIFGPETLWGKGSFPSLMLVLHGFVLHTRAHFLVCAAARSIKDIREIHCQQEQVISSQFLARDDP